MDIIFYAHSGWRYLVILISLVALVKYLIGWIGRGNWSSWDQRIGLAVPIVYDVQLLLGIVLWLGLSAWRLPPLAAWEHPVTTIVAVAVNHVTWVWVRRRPDSVSKYRTGFIGFLIGAAIMGLGVWRITSG